MRRSQTRTTSGAALSACERIRRGELAVKIHAASPGYPTVGHHTRGIGGGCCLEVMRRRRSVAANELNAALPAARHASTAVGVVGFFAGRSAIQSFRAASSTKAMVAAAARAIVSNAECRDTAQRDRRSAQPPHHATIMEAASGAPINTAAASAMNRTRNGPPQARAPPAVLPAGVKGNINISIMLAHDSSQP